MSNGMSRSGPLGSGKVTLRRHHGGPSRQSRIPERVANALDDLEPSKDWLKAAASALAKGTEAVVRFRMSWPRFLLVAFFAPVVVVSVVQSSHYYKVIRAAVETTEVKEHHPPQHDLRSSSSSSNASCYRYDPARFQTSPSVVTYFPDGRLGNAITAFLTLFWLKLDMGYDVYFERQSLDRLEAIFEGVTPAAASGVRVLDEDLCDWQQFGFVKYEGDLAHLGDDPAWKTGKAIQIYMSKANFMRHEVQGGRQYLRQFRRETLEVMRPRAQFRRQAQITLERISRKMGARPGELTFVGIHNRRGDYLAFRKKWLKLENIYEDYFDDAAAYFRGEEFGGGDPDKVVFVYVSDDMKWGRRKLKHVPNIFFEGCGQPDNDECIGRDFALLASCNHTILTHGSFGHWAANMVGDEHNRGQVYTEYGPLIHY